MKDYPLEFREKERGHSITAARNTVLCHVPYPNNFRGRRADMENIINSGPARFTRLSDFHPGIIVNNHAALEHYGYPKVFL